jgi:hypothetical protein
MACSRLTRSRLFGDRFVRKIGSAPPVPGRARTRFPAARRFTWLVRLALLLV